jgi:hypothetical protein
MPHDINNQHIFKALPLKPNGHRKTRMRMSESLPNRQTPGMMRPVELAGGAFGNKKLQPNQWNMLLADPSWRDREP